MTTPGASQLEERSARSAAPIAAEVERRRTFAIISHPDAGKTTLTEKLLLLGGAIQVAGTVKARKSARHARSDWMEIEKHRGISVTSSVMQFQYAGRVLNLLDTPGHGDFSEDTYRTLTAVDSCLMVIDAAKGVEERTVKLMEVCRMRRTPIITLINKLDRDSREPIELLDEIERMLAIGCAPVNWPIGSGREFRGLYRHADGRVRLHAVPGIAAEGGHEPSLGLTDPALQDILGSRLVELRDELELIAGAGHEADRAAYLEGRQTPVFFGSALRGFGVRELLDFFVDWAPPPQPRPAAERVVAAAEPRFSGFVFKVQANMDPAHHDRVAFLRICSGEYRRGLRLHQVRTGKDMQVNAALSFLADERDRVERAVPGDIIGLHNHGTIRIGDTFTEGERLNFSGIPHFAPELFRRVVLKDPLRAKALAKGLTQLSEEGATQVFRPLESNELILGAVGLLQFDVVAWRLRHEYGVECAFEPVQITTARWVRCKDQRRERELRARAGSSLALDGDGNLAYLAPTRINLNLTMERWPEVEFLATREL